MRRSVLFLSLFLSISAFADRNLPQILRDGLKNNPDILEAQANEAASYAVLDRTKASKYPSVTANAAQPMATNNSYDFNPSLNAQWTIFDFGKTDAQIDADTIETIYQYHIVEETREKWAYDLSGYYISAVMAKLQLEAAKDNLARHQHITEQTKIITQYDPGRRSEYTQSQSRLISVQDSIVNFERNLDLNLRRMSRYVKPAVKVEELTDPFADLSSDELLKRYPLSKDKLQKNASYLAQEQVLEKNKANLQVAEKDIFPRINLEATADKDDQALYLTASVDVFDKTKTPTVKEQEFLIESSRAKLEQMTDSLLEEAELAIIEMKRAESQIAIIDKQIKELQQVVVDYEDQFKISVRTLLNVVDAYSELASAKQSKVQAQYSLMSAKLSYLNASGAIANWAKLPAIEHQNPAGRTIDVTVSAADPEESITVDVKNEQIKEQEKIPTEVSVNSEQVKQNQQSSNKLVFDTNRQRDIRINKNGEWEFVDTAEAPTIKISLPDKK